MKMKLKIGDKIRVKGKFNNDIYTVSGYYDNWADIVSQAGIRFNSQSIDSHVWEKVINKSHPNTNIFK